MEPVSTVILAIAFFAPATLTRRIIWEGSPTKSSEVMNIEKKYTAKPLLANTPTPVTSHLLYRPDAVPTLSMREQLKRETEAYSELKAGWDGPNSAVPSTLVIDLALQLIDGLPARLPLPRPMLSASGELGLYWDLELGYAELSVEPDGRISFFSREMNGKERFDEGLTPASLTQAWHWHAIGHLDAVWKAAA